MAELEVQSRPNLGIGTTDLESAARIRSLDRLIHNDPNHFMTVCREVGGMALEHFPTVGDQPIPDPSDTKYPERDKKIRGSLNTFLDNNDIIRSEFDLESDEAIYGNPAVTGLIKTLNNMKGRSRKVGSRTEQLPNPEADNAKRSLTALKLALFADRTRIWNEAQKLQPAVTTNGAA